MRFVLQHGWGFDSSCWHEWLKLTDSAPILVDRGYWGHPAPLAADALPDNAIVVAHSLGLHILPQELLHKAAMVVVIGGFAHFHGETPADGRFTRRHIDRMRSRLDTEPEALLRDFYRDCEYPAEPPAGDTLATSLLATDLLLLDKNRIGNEQCRDWPITLLLHGRNDRIVAPRRAEELAALPRRSRLTMIDDAGHGLPFTHPQLCLNLILDFYRDMAHSGS